MKCTAGYIPDEGVDLDGVNVIQLLQSLLDLALVGLDIDDEDEGVVLLDLLHGALGVEGVQDDVVGIHAGVTGDGDTGVLGGPRELQGLGAVEGGRGADLAGLVELDMPKDMLAMCRGRCILQNLDRSHDRRLKIWSYLTSDRKEE